MHLSGTNCLYLVIQSLELILRQGKAMNGASFLPQSCTKGGGLSYCQRLLISLVFYKLIQVHTNQEWTPRPAGNPPRAEEGFPAPHCGEGGGFPRKNDQNRGEVAGQNKGPNFNFLQQQNNITTLNNAQSGLSIGYARESKK